MEALIEGLKKYTGGIVVITHDHNLIDSIDARVVMMDPKTRSINPTVDTYEGYCQYLSKVSL